jgi:23S rRNA pseudouridine955/2504/2580 synthase
MVPQSKTRPATARQRKSGSSGSIRGNGWDRDRAGEVKKTPAKSPGNAPLQARARAADAKAAAERTPAAALAVRKLVVGEEQAGQRLDNFLLRFAKGVPKSHVYRVVRSGEVRVNGGRSSAQVRLAAGDELRIPPMRLAQAPLRPVAPAQMPAVLYEDEHLLVLDKPSGVAAHGGSGVAHGVIERVRAARPNQAFLELGHRLDRETSGVLLLAKTRRCLVALHGQMRAGEVEKRYLVVVIGDWVNERQHVRFALLKKTVAGGQRRVFVDAEQGAQAHTIFHLLARLGDFSLLEAQLMTGRTHQIRVHLAHSGFRILGDDKYGDFEVNRRAAKGEFGARLGRMFLHAFRVRLAHPVSGAALLIEAPLPDDCALWLQSRDPQAALLARHGA